MALTKRCCLMPEEFIGDTGNLHRRFRGNGGLGRQISDVEVLQQFRATLCSEFERLQDWDPQRCRESIAVCLAKGTEERMPAIRVFEEGNRATDDRQELLTAQTRSRTLSTNNLDQFDQFGITYKRRDCAMIQLIKQGH